MSKYPELMEFSGLNHQSQSFTRMLLINVKMLTISGILIFLGSFNLILSRVEHEKKSFITSGPGME